MKLAAISMIRDEADIIAPFLRHLAAFFDIVYLLDQRSSDGSSDIMREACDARSGWTYCYMDFAGRHQKEATAHFIPQAFDRGADALFFLDSDEFIGFRDKASLSNSIADTLENARPWVFRWRPCVPLGFDQWHFDPGQRLWVGQPNTAMHPKVAISRSLFERDPGIRVTQGSHSATATDGSVVGGGVALGHYFHVPIRSRQQFLQKVFLAAISNFAKHNPMLKESGHMRRLLKAIGERELSDDVLTAISAQYPAMNGITWWQEPIELERRGFSCEILDTAFADFPLRQLPKPDFHQVVSRSLIKFESENLEGGDGTLTFDGGVAKFRAIDRKVEATSPKPPTRPEPPTPPAIKASRKRRRKFRKINKRLAKLEAVRTPRWHVYLSGAAAVVSIVALILAFDH
ncbi:MAG: hypothetical protein GY788_05425 [bacterium]|nr:hypothetical protein [bacterium]